MTKEVKSMSQLAHRDRSSRAQPELVSPPFLFLPSTHRIGALPIKSSFFSTSLNILSLITL